MLTALIIFGIVLVFIFILLFLPIMIKVDTVNDVYLAHFGRIIGLRLSERNEELMLVFNLPFFRKEIFPLRRTEKPEKKAKKEEPKKQKSRISFGKIIAILKSFRVKTFKCSIDTGDFVRNAWLVPVFQYAAPDNITVNFLGEFRLNLFLTNNLWRIGRAYLFGK